MNDIGDTSSARKGGASHKDLGLEKDILRWGDPGRAPRNLGRFTKSRVRYP